MQWVLLPVLRNNANEVAGHHHLYLVIIWAASAYVPPFCGSVLAAHG
jgi:hypothetical protein